MSIARREQGSLYDTILSHNRMRLLVSPLNWTDFHSQLLRIHFIEHPVIFKPVPTTMERLEPSRKGEMLLKDLTTLESLPDQASDDENSAIKHIILTFFPSLSRLKTYTGLNLYFGQLRKTIQIPCVWSHRTEYKPILAYVSRSQLAARRKNRLLPADADRDPYIIAILLAMAQAHFYDEPVSRPLPYGGRQFSCAPAPFRDITLQVITHDGYGDAAKFVVYTATVTATFLTRFMMPHKGPSAQDGSTGMDISYTPVSAWPLLGLKERLERVLGRGITGHPVHDDADHIGFWDPLVEPQPARKRKCPDDGTVPSAAKKRRTAGNHGGGGAGRQGTCMHHLSGSLN
ncbi:hypothetical protein N657DRAFT_244482 [Parathielavia appendiculata]|uniref:Uncharacterized protein n=1 Tax=Parathielavia appendiculata TaxID=2587402 RepID=A0AAN6TTX0_9PEZI|nr:hypothetical protein N657DRAFT_244482 [Parathielavia appendiculata]